MSKGIRQSVSLKTIGILQIIFGAIAIILSFIIIINPAAGIATLILLLSITLLFIGFERIAAGIHSHLRKSSRITNIVLGAMATALGISVIIFPIFATILLVYLLSIGLFVLGVARIFHGFINRHISKWSRALLIGVGLLSIAVSITVLAFPILGLVLITFILAVNLLIVGAESITHGIANRKTIASSSSSSSSTSKRLFK